MFPLTHVWFSKMIFKKENNMTMLGAVFPDITIAGILNYEKTHKDGLGLYNHFKTYHIDYMDFVMAVMTHTVDPKGLDYYCDEHYMSGYKGYCFQKGVSIVDEVIDACNIPSKFGLWKAHNFVEMGIEINILNQEKDICKRLKNAFCDICLTEKISDACEDYYGIDRGILLNSIKKFSTYIELENLNSRTLASKYNLQMQSKHGIAIDEVKSTKIIDKCRELVQDDFDDFIDFTKKRVEESIFSL